jgi:hypothetical protein
MCHEWEHKNSYRILVRKLLEKKPLGRPSVDRGIILKWFLKK